MLLDLWRQIVGEAPAYLEGSGYSGSWDYGAMIEYMFVCLVALLVVILVFRFIITLCRSIFDH